MKFVQRASLILLFCSVTLVGWSQPLPDDPAVDPDVVPITGIEYLILAGAAYGIQRFRKKTVIK